MFVRWDNLKASESGGANRLPGVETETVTRTFDAPEAMGIRFHEVQARSALNSVSPMSHVDFRWTINPYRGRSHACTYCLHGDTPILTADGRTLPIGAANVARLPWSAGECQVIPDYQGVPYSRATPWGRSHRPTVPLPPIAFASS